ncbi:MAG: hypothetical protein H0X34_19740 [Chthoniobacterales bacterium]|nr:hypothetical protein [Chthoniobacterales bacterium]
MNRTNFRLTSPLLALLLTAGLLLGQVAGAFGQDASAGIRQAMTPEEFRAAGLEKLSPDELSRLDAWLQGDREKAAQKATKREKLQLIVSRVDGVITSITPRQIIRLEDGSTWKVAKTDFQFHGRADHPAAAAYKSFFGWKMRIANVAEIYVVPVHRP